MTSSGEPASVERHALRPPRWLPGGDLQTVVPSVAPKPAWNRPVETWDVPVDETDAVRLLISRPDSTSLDGPSWGTVVLLHGLGGSADSVYVLAAARAAFAAGLTVVRMNLRNCGGTAHLATRLYNAGQSEDLAAVLEAMGENFPRPLIVVGFSLGGNIVLRHVGQSGVECRADAAVGVSVPVRLETCLERLEHPRNRPYEYYFGVKLMRQMREVERLRPLPGPARPGWRQLRRLRRVDTLYTAPDAGYPSAEAYYDAASSAAVLAGARRPTLMLSAVNDPMIDPSVLEPHVGGAVRLTLSSNGGHCGFWQASGRRFWAAEPILELARQVAGRPA